MFIPSNAAVGFKFEDKTIVVGHLAHTSVFQGIVGLGYWTEEGVDRNDTNGLIGVFIVLPRTIATTDFYFELCAEGLFFVQGANDLLGIDDGDVGIRAYVASGY